MTAPISGISLPVFPTVGASGVTGTGAASGIGGIGGIGGVTGAQGPSSASGTDFASILASSLDNLQATQSNADNLATQAATGNLQDVADYMIASNEASLATDTVVTIKNQAVNAFNEIMRMPV